MVFPCDFRVFPCYPREDRVAKVWDRSRCVSVARGWGRYRGNSMSVVFEPLRPEIQEARDRGTHDFVGALRATISLRGMRSSILQIVSSEERASRAERHSQPARERNG